MARGATEGGAAVAAPRHWKGFPPGALDFLAELEGNNDRDWFLPRKEQYERTLRAPMMDLVADLTTALAARDLPLWGDPRRALFRINRDTRFARDKRPYKTVVSAVLSRDGEKRSPGVLYVQFGPADGFAALGFHMPEPPHLAAFRAHMLRRRDRWQAVVASLDVAELPLARRDTVTRLPRGIDAAAAGDLAPDLKLKSFVVFRPLQKADAVDPALVDRLAGMAAAGLPLLEFGWSALAERDEASGF